MILAFYKKDDVIREYRMDVNIDHIGDYDLPTRGEIYNYLKPSEVVVESSIRVVGKDDIKNEISSFIDSIESERINEADLLEKIQNFYTTQQDLQMKEFYDRLKAFYDKEGLPYTTSSIEKITANTFNVFSYTRPLD